MKVVGDAGTLSSRRAESIGLITTELVMNSLKHASESRHKGQIVIKYETNGTNWKLSVGDNGVGKGDDVFAQPKTGLMVRASSLRWRKVLTPMLKLWPDPRARLCLLLTRRFQELKSAPHNSHGWVFRSQGRGRFLRYRRCRHRHRPFCMLVFPSGDPTARSFVLLEISMPLWWPAPKWDGDPLTPVNQPHRRVTASKIRDVDFGVDNLAESLQVLTPCHGRRPLRSPKLVVSHLSGEYLG